MDDVADAFASSALLVAAATSASSAAERATPGDASAAPATIVQPCALATVEPRGPLAALSMLTGWTPPPGRTRERAIFETLFGLINGAARSAAAATLTALPLLLERYVTVLRDVVDGVAGAEAGLRELPRRADAGAPQRSAPVAASGATSSLEVLSLATVSGNPEFGFFCECLVAALGAAAGDRALASASPQGSVAAGSPLLLLPAGDDRTTTALRLRAVAALLAVALRHGLYSAHEDVAPHPQIAVLRVVAHTALCAIESDWRSRPGHGHLEERAATTRAALGVFEILLHLDHRLVQPLVERVLAAGTAGLIRGDATAADTAAPVLDAASSFVAALCGVFARLRALPALLDMYWSTGSRMLDAATPDGTAAFRAVFSAPAHTRAFEIAVAGLSGGQLPEIGGHLQRHLALAAARVREVAAAVGAASTATAITTTAESGKKRRRDATSTAVNGNPASLDACFVRFAFVAAQAAAFLRYARIAPSGALAMMGVVHSMGESGAAPVLALYDTGALGAVPHASSVDEAVAAALRLASACSDIALALAAHEPLRALVPSVVVSAASLQGDGLGALDALWPASAFAGLLPRAPDASSAAGANVCEHRIDVRRVAAWWASPAEGCTRDLGNSLAMFAAGRLRALHAVVASQRLGSGPPASAAQASARLFSDLMLRLGDRALAASVLDVCAEHASPALLADFADHLCAAPPAPWQLALWRDSQLYELGRVAQVLPAAWERAARGCVARLHDALQQPAPRPAAAANASAGVAAVRSSKKASRALPAASDAVRLQLAGMLAPESTALSRSQSLRVLIDLVALPTAPAVGLPAAVQSALEGAGALLSFLESLPFIASDSEKNSGVLAALVLALHAAAAVLGGVFYPLPSLRFLRVGGLQAELSGALLSAWVRLSLAGGRGVPPEAPAELGAALAPALLKLEKVTEGPAVDQKAGKKRKSLKSDERSSDELGQAADKAALLKTTLFELLDAAGVLSGARDTWVWSALFSTSRHCEAELLLLRGADAAGASSEAAAAQRRVVATAIATTAQLLASSAGDASDGAGTPTLSPPPAAVLVGRMRLAASLADLEGRADPSSPLGGPVSRFCARAALDLEAWLRSAARGGADDGGGDAAAALSVLECLADLVRPAAAATTAPSAAGAGEQWAATLVTPALLERLLSMPPVLGSSPEAIEAVTADAAALLSYAKVAHLAPLLARAVLGLASGAPEAVRRASIGFVAASISAAARGYYRRGGGGAVQSGSRDEEAAAGEAELRDVCLGDGSKAARDFLTAAVVAALPPAARLAVTLGRASCEDAASAAGSELLGVLALLRLALSHPRAVFLSRELVKVCLEALGPLCDTADALLLLERHGDGTEAAPSLGRKGSGATPMHAGALEDADAGCRGSGQAPVLIEACPAAVAACAALMAPLARHADEFSAPGIGVSDHNPALPYATGPALAAALGVLRAAIGYHRSAALSFWPFGSQLLQSAIVVATTRRHGRVPFSAEGDGFLADAALAAVARACEDVARAIAVARFHAVPLLVRLLIQWSRAGGVGSGGGGVAPPLPLRVRERLLPGLHALFDICRPGELQALHTGLGRASLGPARAQFKELHAAFAAHVKYRGKL